MERYRMACFSPLTAWQQIGPNREPVPGKQLIFKRPEGSSALTNFSKVKLQCNGCIGCKISRSREWALRCVHEASMWTHYNAYITLTFSPEVLQTRRSLTKRPIQLFLKKLRKNYAGHHSVIVDGKKQYPIRYLHAAEYGETCVLCGKNRKDCRKAGTHVFKAGLGRPHHHLCVFNFRFDDMYVWIKKKSGNLYRSEKLEKLWSMEIEEDDVHKYRKEHIIKDGKKTNVMLGHAYIGEVEWKSAAYVARYITKKITGNRATNHYRVVDRHTGEIHECLPEFLTMSNRPGIGKYWYEKRGCRDVISKDFITHEGVKHGIPRYYRKLLEREEPEAAKRVNENRRKKALDREKAGEYSAERLAAKRKRFVGKVRKLVREYENGS